MKIPKQFKLLGQTITVKFDPDKFTNNECVGFADYRKNEIQLHPGTETRPINREQLEANFLHEVTHFVLYHAGASYSGKEDYMHQDEGFVDLVSCLFHQVLETSGGELCRD
jgi:predicted SprT family Zn-dependent metalloprotease